MNSKSMVCSYFNLALAFLFFSSQQVLISQNDNANKNNISNDRKGFVLFSLGTSSPLGNLANKNIENVDAGLANLGADLKFDCGYRIFKYVGLQLQLSNNSFPIDLKTMADYLAKQTTGFTYTLKSKSGWRATNMMAGIYGYLSLDKNHKFIFVPKVLVGYALNNSPAYKITASTLINGMTLSFTADQSSARSEEPTFSYNFGTSLNYNFTKRIFINGNIDYIGSTSKANFKNVVINYSDGSNDITDFKMDFKSFNITLGIGFCFGKNL